MASNPNLYEKIVIKTARSGNLTPTTKTYKGFSSVSDESQSYSLYDLSLIKQDLINHFHIRKGERLENPEFGTIIWDVLFEPLTDEIKTLVANDVEQVINYDPRISANEVVITAYDSGLLVECSVTYLPYFITEKLTFRFDQSNNLLTL